MYEDNLTSVKGYDLQTVYIWKEDHFIKKFLQLST